jgi:hypothetical protein
VAHLSARAGKAAVRQRRRDEAGDSIGLRHIKSGDLAIVIDSADPGILRSLGEAYAAVLL